MDLFAPAAHVVSAWLGATPNPANSCRLSGTSMAAPHAAGAAALFLQANPTASPAQVKQALLSRAQATLTQLPAGTPNALLTVLEGTARLTFTPPGPLDLGTVAVGAASAPARVTVTSSGTLPVSLGTLVLTGQEAGDFSLVDGCSGRSLAASASCTVDVTFRPLAAGARTATLSVPSSAGPESLALGGVGSPTPLFAVSRGGTGAGRVVSSPTGIDCGATCRTALALGTSVTLTATPEPGSLFVGWSGLPGCAAAAACSFTMSATTLGVTATFDVAPADAGHDAGVEPSDAGHDAGVDGGAGGDAGAGTDAGLVSVEGSVVGGCGCASADALGLLAFSVAALLRRRTRP